MLRHAAMHAFNVVTARVDEVEFHLPIFIGDLVICTAQVVYVGNSSMEIVVIVEVEDLETEGKTGFDCILHYDSA